MRFVLGMGSQKAGTTFVYNYLENLEQVGFMEKEPHVFGYNWREVASQRKARKMVWHFSKKRYLQDVAEFMNRHNLSVSGDFTPRNALMPQTEFRSTVGLLRASDFFTTRVIWQLREPVDRILSQIQMHERLGWETPPDLESALESDTLTFARSDYKSIGEKISSVVPGEELFVQFYEHMDQTSQNLDSFLGINKVATSFSGWKAQPHIHSLSSGIFQNAVWRLEDSYIWCFENFPKTRRLWTRAYDIISGSRGK